MKLLQFILVAVLLLSISCTNNKAKENSELEEAAQKIEALAEEVEKSTEEIDKEINDLEEDLKQLDSIIELE